MALILKIAAGIVLAVVLLVAGCAVLVAGAGSTGDDVITVPAVDMTLNRIGSMTDCDRLQAEFDTAADNHDRARAGSRAARAAFAYMDAADARMREVGCY